MNNPKTFNEKLQWLKINDRNPIYSQLTDKYEVRGFVSETIGEEYLIPLIGIWNSVDEIDFDMLPQRFILKCTHDSQSVVTCRDKSKFDIKRAKVFLNSRMLRNYFFGGREYQYKNIKPRIVGEQYIEESDGQLKDYKFFCFKGIPKIMLVVTDRVINKTKFDFFDMQFNKLPIRQYYPNSSKSIECPRNFGMMKKLAEKMTKNFVHCRVDFYEVNGKIYFGELTFTHFCGFVPFEPSEWDYKIGSWVELPK
ncbi:MAG: glycosyl transferase [Bacteroidales bacterium]|nr:glycosyl transferase [Bacteroidales bacterium]